jgi:PAS domain S-box-containing protein
MEGIDSIFSSEKIFNLSSRPMGILSKDFKLIAANPSLLQLTGLDFQNILDHSFQKLLHPEDLEIAKDYLAGINKDLPAVFFESRLINSENEVKWFSWEIILNKTTGHLFFSGTDITGAHITQSVLEEHTNKLLEIIELVPHPIFLKDSNAHYILVNQAQADLFSASKEDFIGKDDHHFIKNEEELKGVRASDSVVLNKKKNIILPEQNITHPNGQNKILHTSKIPFLSSFNGDVNILGVSIDITEIKKSEKELRKINFELDTFVYHASHDLKAPLCSLEGLFNLINTEKDEAFRKKCVEEGLKSIKRLDGFISDLTDLSRNNRTDVLPSNIKFKKIINRTLDSLKYITNADRIKVNLNINKEADFYCDKQRMKIIFMNLISNAIKYQQENGPLPTLSININVTKEYAEIEFHDNGIGIEEKYIPYVFDMFFRGTILSTGSGLGLYIVKEIILKLEGSIKLVSDKDFGTTFNLQIPNLAFRIDTA